MIRIWQLNLLLPDGVAVRGEATHSANTLEIDLRQPFANLSESREIAGSGSPEDDAHVDEVASQVLERLYRLAVLLQNRRPELVVGLVQTRARLARLPGLVSEDQLREARRELRGQLRRGMLQTLEYQQRLTRLRKASRKSRWAFDASLQRSDAAGDRRATILTRELSWYTSAPPSEVAASMAAVRLAWDDFFRKASQFALTDVTRWQVVRILDGRMPLVNQLPAVGCCKCGRAIESVGGRRLLPRAIEIEGPNLDEGGRQRWICQRCANSECRACGSTLSNPMGRDILFEDGHIRHAMIVGAPCCSNSACSR